MATVGAIDRIIKFSIGLKTQYFAMLVGVIGLLLGLIFADQKIGLLFADSNDIDVYFRSSRWIVEGGRLYKEVPSEYPPMANVIFATWRYVDSLANPERKLFTYLWITSSGVVYIWAVFNIATQRSLLATLAWLAPAPIYFALFRYDIYPAAATLLALLAVRRTSYTTGAFWLGLAVALKGYALVMLPAFCVFIFYQRGLIAAFYSGVIVLTPMALSLVVTLAFSDLEAVLAPFQQQFGRSFNLESTYDAINFVFPGQFTAQQIPLVSPGLQAVSALGAAAMRPRSFADLVNASIFAVLGFVTFSTFYSPQFLLWILPLVSFSESRVMLYSSISFSWLTYLHFPISYVAHNAALFKGTVVALTMVRLFMMFLTMFYWYKGTNTSASVTRQEETS